MTEMQVSQASSLCHFSEILKITAPLYYMFFDKAFFELKIVVLINFEDKILSSVVGAAFLFMTLMLNSCFIFSNVLGEALLFI